MTRLRALVGPWWPYLVLTAVPLAAFVLPDLISGRILMSGDNIQQNYPLRVLVGSMFRHGQLPFWNPYIFSGTPLMADFNAGAFYPLIAFFVGLPDRAAWVVTEVVVFAAIAVGMYVFLRALALSTVACFLGAATYAFAGPVLSQVNHLDMTEGFVAIPWMLLAVHHITRDGRWRWSVLLGVAYASVILAGAPEAMLDEALLVLAYAALSAGLSRHRWWTVVSRGAAGAALAMSLAAIQWLPGLEAIRSSQRGAGVAAAAGSYPSHFSILALIPYLDGGYGHLGEAQFFSHYNLPEVGIYLGILPLIALVTLVHPRWPSRIAPRDRLTWYGVAVFGYLLALGSNTPFEGLFNRLPLYGHQRLQSRNMITVATAVCVLFAGWVDRSEPVRPREPLKRYDRVMSLVPLAVVISVAVWALAAPGSLADVFAGVSASPAVTTTLRRASLWALVLCTGGAALVWIRPHMRRPNWMMLVTAFVVVDLGIMAITSQLATGPSNEVLAGTTPVQQLMAANLAPGARMVNYDPQTYDSYPGSPQGIPDLNVVPGLPSVSGYASIVNNTYESVTHTHEQGDLDIGQLASGTLSQLDLREVVTLPEYFLVPIASMPARIDDEVQLTESFGTDPVLVRGYGADFNDTAYPFYPGARPALQAGQVASWYFGESVAPTRVTLLLARPVPTDTAVRVGLLEPDGSTRWGQPVPVPAGSAAVTTPVRGGAGVGLTVATDGPLPAQRVVITAAGHLYELDGALSSAIVPGAWSVAGFAQGYAVFTLRRPPQPLTAVTVRGRRLPVQVLSSTTKSEEVRVQTSEPATLVRSVAWDSGWTASVSVDSGPARRVPVSSVGLVQQVRIPAGDDRIVFHYRPPHLAAASVLSLGASAALVVLLGVCLVRRRRAVARQLSRADAPG